MSPNPIDLTMDSTPIKSNLFNSDPKDILGKEFIVLINNPESKLISLIREIIDKDHPAPRRSVFKFENNIKAATHNEKILKSSNYDYEKILNSQKGTNIYYGSEFREESVLEKY